MIVPSREICLQIAEQVAFYGSANTVRCVPVVGGLDYIQQKKELESAPHFVIGTPGRLAEQLEGSELARKYLKNLEFVVLDEVDRLMEDSLFHFVEKVEGGLTSDTRHGR